MPLGDFDAVGRHQQRHVFQRGAGAQLLDREVTPQHGRVA